MVREGLVELTFSLSFCTAALTLYVGSCSLRLTAFSRLTLLTVPDPFSREARSSLSAAESQGRKLSNITPMRFPENSNKSQNHVVVFNQDNRGHRVKAMLKEKGKSLGRSSAFCRRTAQAEGVPSVLQFHRDTAEASWMQKCPPDCSQCLQSCSPSLLFSLSLSTCLSPATVQMWYEVLYNITSP